MGGLLRGLSRVRFSLGTVFLENAGKKGVSGAGGYFMGYYTIWLAFVKKIFVPFWEIGRADEVDFVATPEVGIFFSATSHRYGWAYRKLFPSSVNRRSDLSCASLNKAIRMSAGLW